MNSIRRLFSQEKDNEHEHNTQTGDKFKKKTTRKKTTKKKTTRKKTTKKR